MSTVEPPIDGHVVSSMTHLQARLKQARSRVAYEESRKLESDRRLEEARKAFIRILDVGNRAATRPGLVGGRAEHSAEMRIIAREALDIIGDPRDARVRSARQQPEQEVTPAPELHVVDGGA